MDTRESRLGVNFENAVVGWEPIGNDENPFNGTFDGNGHDISDLNIKRGGTSGIGIFGFTGQEVEIRDIGLVDLEVKGLGYVGGLVGYNKGNISDSYVTGEVSGVSSVGGLVGLSLEGEVKTSYATTDVSGMEGIHVGGLVGLSHSTVNASYATGDVSGEGHLGGLVGLSHSTIYGSYATGDINGEENVGELVGNNAGISKDSIENSYATGNVNGEEFVGGLVGHNKANIENSYASGDVNGEKFVGGLVGLNSAGPGPGYPDMPFPSTVKTSYASGEVTGEENVGGLVGLSESGNVTHSYWDIETSGIEESDGGTGLTTDVMTGEEAPKNMDGFDFEEVWETVGEDDEDAEENGYPILQELDREEQLEAQNIYGDDDGIPGFTSLLLLVASIIAVAIYQKKSKKR
ncbi:MAG: GLUG motif-containing protein [Thermoplasmata archaeon]